LSSFGEGLKREREKKKITLDQVAVSTKIGVRMLRALEEQKFDQLPGGIFNKGFVRAYARYLALDEEKAVADYLVASTPANSAPQEDLELRAMADQKDRERQRQARLTRDVPWGWVAIILLLVALGLSLWGLRPGREAQSGKAAVPETPTQHDAQIAEVVTKDSSASSAVAAATQGPVKDTSARSATIRSDATEPASSGSIDESDFPSEKTVSRSIPASKTFTVLVTANESSWLSIAADGKEIFTGTLIAPGVQLVRAKQSITVRAGNLGGLDVDFNGKRLPPQGKQGEAKTLTFQSQGLVDSTATTSSQSQTP
jgi:cytoskeleton protein RodZ